MQEHKKVKDIIKPNLKVLFVGINPGIETARTGQHFAHPSNRFWKTMYKSGFTNKLLKPSENKKLLNYNLGITNLIPRPTKSERELTKEEFVRGKKQLLKKIKKYNPEWAVFVGLGLYRNTFNNKSAHIGPQKPIYSTKVWALPQPSGLNAHYPPKKLTQIFKKFKSEAGL